MALVPTSSTQISIASADPTANLASALRDFEAILSDKQRLIFRSNYTQPIAADVLAFVSRIDADNKGRASKCVAPRLCTFLECTVQFTGIVNTFVQSNPAIAALVWGGVRTAILTASNYASYFDKVTSMIMKVGRTSPTYARFGQLYQGCPELQAALCNYYTAIIRICIKIIQVSQRSGLLQVLSPVFNPFEIEFKNITEELTQCAKGVDVQISFAAKKAAQDEALLSEAERKESSRHRRLMSAFQNDWKSSTEQLRLEKTARQQLKMRIEASSNICSIDHVKPWRQARQQHLPGTGDWFVNDHSFKAWYSSPNTSILWCSGILGAGKTIFMSTAIAHILDLGSTSDDIVSYHFCRSNDTETLTARNILANICRQVLEVKISKLTGDALVAFFQKTCTLSTVSNVVDLMLAHMVDRFHYVMVDGLDECEIDEISQVSHALTTILNSGQSKIRFMFTGRPGLETRLFMQDWSLYKVVLSGSLIHQDIERYISSVLDRCLEERSLSLGDSHLIVRIAEVLRSGARGMFLWVRLLIEELCCCNNDNEILDTLVNQPQELSEIYASKIKRIRKQLNSRVTVKMLEMMCILRRDLTVDEMREALSVEVGQHGLSRNDMPNSMSKVILACRGLVQVDDEDDAISFIHYSIREHLTSAIPVTVSVAEASHTLGLYCLTYLSYTDFERRLTRQRPSDLSIDVLAVGDHVLDPDQKSRAKLAQKLLRMKFGANPAKAKVTVDALQSVSGMSNNGQLLIDQTQYQFLRYAKENWIYHVNSLRRADNSRLWDAFCNLVVKQEQAQELTSHFFADSPHHYYLLRFALNHDHAALIRYLMETQNWRAGSQHFFETLVKSSSKGKYGVREAIVSSLMRNKQSEQPPPLTNLDHSRFIMTVLNPTWGTLVGFSSAEMNEFARSVLIDIMESNDLRNLEIILEWGGPSFLMRIKEDDSSGAIDRNAQRFFQHVIEQGSEPKIRRFCELFEIDVEQRFDNGLKPISVALAKNQINLVSCLLDLRADPKPFMKHDELEPLAQAAHCGHVSIAELLIRRGADCSRFEVDQGKWTPLEAAVRGNRAATVEFLLIRFVYPNTRIKLRVPSYPEDVLGLACQLGYVTIVKLLLAAGAEYGMGHPQPPILVAVRFNQPEIVSVLLATGLNLACDTDLILKLIEETAHLKDDQILQILIDQGKMLDHLNLRRYYTRPRVVAFLKEVAGSKSERLIGRSLIRTTCQKSLKLLEEPENLFV